MNRVLPEIDVGMLDVRKSRQLPLQGLRAPDARKGLDAERVTLLVVHLMVTGVVSAGHGRPFLSREQNAGWTRQPRAACIIPYRGILSIPLGYVTTPQTI